MTGAGQCSAAQFSSGQFSFLFGAWWGRLVALLGFSGPLDLVVFFSDLGVMSAPVFSADSRA
ncbi:MAG: hypothetical protein EBT04_15825 [Betaproteobacteria bacterium]|nr:hypothetical protein [Betaproteobacteria bacterium]